MEILGDLGERIAALEEGTQWTEDKDDATDDLLDTAIVAVEKAGGVVYLVDHPLRDARAALVLPDASPAPGLPLVVSLHGYGANLAFQAAYVPFHDHVVSRGFALLLANGSHGAAGNRSWNPTDDAVEGGKAAF